MPLRGEIWGCDLNPTRGHEQAGHRPVLVVSANQLNQGPAGLAVVVPLTTKDKRIPLHIPIDPPEGGVRERSFAMCEAVRTVSTERLSRHWGTVEARTLLAVEDRLRIVLEL